MTLSEAKVSRTRVLCSSSRIRSWSGTLTRRSKSPRTPSWVRAPFSSLMIPAKQGLSFQQSTGFRKSTDPTVSGRPLAREENPSGWTATRGPSTSHGVTITAASWGSAASHSRNLLRKNNSMSVLSATSGRCSINRPRRHRFRRSLQRGGSFPRPTCTMARANRKSGQSATNFTDSCMIGKLGSPWQPPTKNRLRC